ncbi:MAG: hypothetical protein A2172_05320 [Candidatus Woykebacteria bacterium RBG_13_40_15]|uniref:PsbP C-terminal domain-containing protein n=1 Tax=Candidatus Woykebacteria bacterium RBG_13_40_15 TaxID=1802593 RepID=A0A1G1W595_9BACT|nr:MAG: hypothetical protein A2172_05320 [Candidatus Woykebacteria bacterium RBG_13_40_15]
MPDVNPVPSQQPTTTVATKNPINWKNIIMGVVIGAVLFGGGGYLVYNAYQPKSSEPTVTTTKKATPSAKPATPSAQKDETAEVASLTNSYTDTFFNITFKFPTNWEKKSKSGIEACEPSVGPKNVSDSGFSICEFGQSSPEQLASLPPKNIVSYKKDFTSAGKRVIRQVVTENNKATLYAYMGNVTHDGQNGTLTVTAWPEGSGLTIEKFVDLFDKILSTFKFL